MKKHLSYLIIITLILICSISANALLDNDICANATTINSSQVNNGTILNGTNINASDESGSFGASCFFSELDVWYKVTPTTTAFYSVSTDFSGGTLTDTEIALYSGTCNNPTEIACNQDAGDDFLSTLVTELAANQTYYIQVSGAFDDQGTFKLQVVEVETLDNDACAGATLLTVDDLCNAATPNGTNIDALDEGNAASCFDDSFYEIKDVWYKFVAPAGGKVHVEILNETGGFLDYEIAVYGGNCGSLSEVACDNNARDELIFTNLSVTSGETYFVQVNGAFAEESNFCLNIYTPLPNDICTGAIPLVVGSRCTGNNNGTVSGALDEETVANGDCLFNPQDVWFSFIPQTSGWVTVSTDFASGTAENLSVSLLSGNCNTLTEIDCAGFSNDLTNQVLNPDEDYYLRIDANSDEGTFCVEVTERDCSGDWILDSQAKVNALANLNCSTINGYVTINGSNITDLSGLSDITSITGYLQIFGCSQLTTLDGLENIVSIGGYLNISSNDVLDECCAVFPVINLEGVGGNISISNNATNCASQTVVLENCTPPCPTRMSDSLELVNFYNMTGGNNWKFIWNLNDPMDTWFGVTLNEGGCVEKISLPTHDMVGTIPNLDLAYIEEIDLRSNDITGIATLNQMPNLNNLHLGSNELMGSVPNFDLPALQILYLANNNFTDCPQLTGLPSLVECYLSINELSAVAEFNQMPNLERLFLNNNKITGTIPNFDLPALKRLFLSSNQFTVASALNKLPSLQRLTVDGNQLTFEDLLPIKDRASSSFAYSPQDICDEPLDRIDIIKDSGDDWVVNLGIDASLTTNRYRWKKDGSNYGDVLTDNMFSIPNLHLSDAGDYQCEISNQALPDLTLSSCIYDLEVVCQDYTPDSLALVALYDATDGANWNNPWDLSQPVTTWQGVNTSDDGCLFFLGLSGQNLVGSLPPEIGDLQDLNFLLLNSNKLSGALPSTIGNLVHLSGLSLEFNELSGAMPSSIGQLTNLTRMDWQTNEFTSLPPEIGNLANLETINMFNNKITTIPPEIGNLTNLEILSLGNNALGSSKGGNGIPTAIGNLNMLKSLGLGGNGLQNSELPAELGNLINLEGLALWKNKLTAIPNWVYNLNNLTFLTLWANEITGGISPDIGNLTKLSTLTLFNNQLTGTIPSEIGDLTQLKELSLGGNNLTGTIPAFIGNMQSLERLSLNHNDLTGDIPPEIGDLTNLTSLSLNGNHFNVPFPVELFDLVNLTSLDLSYNTAPNNLGANGANQKSVNITIPSEIGNLTKLEWLTLNNSDFTGEIPVEIADLTELRKLHLQENNFSGCIPVGFSNFCDLNSNPSFLNFRMEGNPLLPFEGDADEFCASTTQIGASCNDGNPATENEVIGSDCVCSTNPLPLVLLDFQIKKTKNNHAQLTWQVADEVDFSHYEIQRATDGKTWKTIGEQAGQQQAQYRFIDRESANLKAYATLYYRLVMVDLDGSVDYSPVRSLYLERDTKQEVVLIPNPATDRVIIKVKNVETALPQLVEMWDLRGNVVERFTKSTMIDEQEWEINLSQLPAGVYLVRMVGQDQIINQRLIVQ